MGLNRGIPVALTIAGSDSSGGAGVVADVKTFAAHGVWAAVALTAVTAQDTTAVIAVHAVPSQFVTAQIRAVADDLGPRAIKTGMLATSSTVEAVVAAVRDLSLGPLVVDPVLRASTGAALLDGDGDALSALVALATVVTPNLEEAAGLVGGPVDDRRTMEAAARTLLRRGARAVLVTGGHLGHDQPAADCLVLAGRADAVWLEGPRLAQPHTHGSGCVLSAAITAQLARGADVETACRQAKRFTAGAIAAGLPLGKGTGPVNPAVLGTSAVNPAV